jgi:leader peptidase (prepilin peptidase)/N-methyltransferase
VIASGIPSFDIAIFVILGLLIGSFLNVVIHRLPTMLEQQWARESAEFSGVEVASTAPFNLLVPRSRCPHCEHAIVWHENIPLLSYALLRGRCAGCKTRISPRYPLIELMCSALFGFCATRFGTGAEGLVWCSFSAVLLALAMIDWDTTLLPDDLTLPLLWGGLIAAALHWIPVNLVDALWGAVGGYMSLWLVYWAFKLLTGKDGMGYGDFKLYAALGVWFGWQCLIPIILMASVIGAIVGIALKINSKLREGGYIPFGPFLAGAGFTALLLGPNTVRQFAGL